MKTARSTRTRSPFPAAPTTEAAVVVEVGERLRVRRSRDGAPRDVVEARLARIAGYVPSEGDRVLVCFGPEESYVLAVLHAAAPETLRLPDGARAELVDGRLELRDPAGGLLVRYADGHAEIAAPTGDLRLTAPRGRVTIDSALDVSVRSGRDVAVAVGRRFEVATEGGAAGTRLALDPKRAVLGTPELDVTTARARLATGRATVLARSIATTAEHLAQKVVKYELTAERLVERTRDTFRDASDLVQQRAGRLRTLVEGVWSSHARRTVLVSSDETSIDGEKILLG
ncbi:MAG: DUF3540 domain-containing protein [Polyangiaceae bacterium]|nr:DUF3540 domain-containing protein [Polyangiaceae bacterium]